MKRMTWRTILWTTLMIATAAWAFQGQRLDFPAMFGMGLIVAGVAVMQLFSKTATH